MSIIGINVTWAWSLIGRPCCTCVLWSSPPQCPWGPDRYRPEKILFAFCAFLKLKVASIRTYFLALKIPTEESFFMIIIPLVDFPRYCLLIGCSIESGKKLSKNVNVIGGFLDVSSVSMVLIFRLSIALHCTMISQWVIKKISQIRNLHLKIKQQKRCNIKLFQQQKI